MDAEKMDSFLDRMEDMFVKMLNASEGRIDRTNEMVCKLSDSMHDLAVESKNTAQMYATAVQSYDKHLDKLQDRCTHMQVMFEDCQKLNIKLAETIAQQEKTMQKVLDGISRVNINNYKLDSDK